jgi:hypothetical protein
MKTLLKLLFAVPILFAVSITASAADSPNIVLIMADDI